MNDRNPALSADLEPSLRAVYSESPRPSKPSAQSFTLNTATMSEIIPQLPNYDEPSLDKAFSTLASEARKETKPHWT